MKSRANFLMIAASLGFAFLYLPIISLVIFSFNESKLVTVWGGFSTKWYTSLLENEALKDALVNSLIVASVSASLATVLGTIAALSLTRLGNFRGKTLLSGMVTSPMVMPDVIIGLSLLLLFVAMEGLIGWPAGRSLTTIIIAHTTFCMAYVTVVVQSRLSNMDESLQEAALDLGAKPFSLFFLITLPLIIPALVSGWLLAFTLSFDDLVIASFVAGPGNSTLPMIIFSKVRLGVSPDINALATIMISIVALGVLVAIWNISRSSKRKKV
ncbi:ABC transporter permease subunit [Thiofilum flexile]|uniref:ABC transporter permease subunit n=1 Tax=Thiofilum flexile TaxID=125627 RepID=UPI00036297EC|nr:ABC transporter permease subunit [Thiofilum flexile]